MRRHVIGVIGGVLVLIGVLGAAAVALVSSSTTPGTASAPPGATGFTSAGQRIFLTGVGHAGTIPRQGGFGMMGSAGCANCHGPDGRGRRIGGMMGVATDAPDIRYSTLTSPHKDEGQTESGFTDAEIAAAIREGKDPNGGSLSAYMPRWQMDDQDMSDLLAYLKELK